MWLELHYVDKNTVKVTKLAVGDRRWRLFGEHFTEEVTFELRSKYLEINQVNLRGS